MARRGRYSLTSLLRHPLLLVVPVLLLLNMAGLSGSLRLNLLEPIALASGQPDIADSSLADPTDAEVLRLRGELAALVSANELLRQGYSQLADLGDVGFAAEAIPARIIVRADSGNFRHSIHINRGASDGVLPGHAVTVGQVLIGVVLEASANVSVVRLVTDPGSRVPVLVLPRNGPALAGDAKAPETPAVKKEMARSLSDLSLLKEEDSGSSPSPASSGLGQLRIGGPELPAIEAARASGPRQRATRGVLHGGTDRTRPRLPMLPLRDVDVDSGVHDGMLVITSGSLGLLPHGLLVGFVESVHSRNTFLDITVAAAVDLSQIDVVTVIPYQRPSLEEVSRMLAPDHHLDRE